MGKYSIFNKKICFYVLALAFLMFFSTTNVYARLDEGGGGNGTTTYSVGLECFYQSDDYIKLSFKGSGNNYQGADDRDTFVKDPAACGLVVWQKTSGTYETYAYCETSRGNELIWPNKYDSYFGEGKSLSQFGYKSGKGVTKCPASISFDTPHFISAPTNSQLDVKDFKFGGGGMKLVSNKTEKITKKLSKAPSTKSKVRELLSGKTSEEGYTYYGTPGAGPSDYNGGLNGGDTTLPDGSSPVDISSITDYYKISEMPDVNTGITPDDEIDCYELLGDDIASLIKNAALAISVVGVVILVITLSFDFIKAVTSGDNDALPKAFSNAKNRIIAVIVLLLLPMLVSAIVSLANNNLVTDEYGNIKVGNVSDCIGSN